MKLWNRLLSIVLLLFLVAALVPSQATAQSLERARRAGDVRSDDADEARLRALSRILMSRSRNLADLKIGEHEVLVHSGKLDTKSPDLESLEQLAPGGVQVLTAAASTKLRTEVDLDFGGKTVKAGNVAVGHPGLYSLWLKRVDQGWHLVFNQEPDVWGTQRDPKQDVEEVALDYETSEETSDELEPALLEAESGGILELRWGPHRWSAPFSVVDS